MIHFGRPLRSFFDFVQATDDHASAHLPLLDEAESLITSGNAAPELRQSLASKLERWRYHRLNRGQDELVPQEQQLIEALDLTANALAGRPARPPRNVRAALADASADGGSGDAGLACLDRDIPLEEIVARAADLTRENFGCFCASPRCSRWPVLLYAPLYLSNYCINHCVYCGFRHPAAIGRTHLSLEESLRETKVLQFRGFRHLLLVAGDYPQLTTTEYYAEALRALCGRGVDPAIEIAPQSTESYAALAAAGACGVTLYQETYNERLYAKYHPRGTKVSYDWRLEGLERAAEAGVPRLGLGFLLGLADPREELRALLRHGRYLAQRFPHASLAFSLPRIHEAPPGFDVPYPVDDELFIRMYCALRVAFPQAVLVLSTREPAGLRNRLTASCVTQLSAGSCTAPGGYGESRGHAAGEQFPVCDHRSAGEVITWLIDSGFEPRWELFGPRSA